MIEEYEKLLDCKNHLRNNINVFIETFVKFYGEEYRETIETNLSKAIFIAYREPKTTETILRKIENLISKDIWVQKVQELGFKEINEEDLALNYSFDLEFSLPIYSFKEFLKQYEMGPEEREKDYIETSYLNIKRFIPEITKEEFERIIKTKTIPDKYSKIPKIIKGNLEYYMNLSNIDRDLNRHFGDSQELLNKIDPNITIENFSYYLDNEELSKLCELAHSYDEIKATYQSRMHKYDKYLEEARIEKEISSSLGTKYHILLMEENKDLLTDEELRILETVKQDPSRNFMITSRMRKLFGYGVKSNHILDVFSEETDEILKNPDTKSWRIDSIKQERIEYFKTCGIDLHNDTIDVNDEYDILINHEDVIKLWPKKQQVKKFIDSRNKLLNAYNIEYYENQPAHIEMRKEIDSLGLLDKDDPINASLYTGSQARTMVCPNIIKKDNVYDLLSIIMINCNTNDGVTDHNIVHELNHQLELHLQSVEGNEYKAICGWDVVEGEINQDKIKETDTLAPDLEKRKYELMNEIVNELITQDICGLLKEHVFDTENNRKTKNQTSYEETFYIIEDFYNEFKKEILESRKDGNMEIIWNKVGKDNFDDLSELFNLHYENFGGFKYLSLVSDLNNKKDTIRTKVYNDIIERKNKIMEQMRLYSMKEEIINDESNNHKATLC